LRSFALTVARASLRQRPARALFSTLGVALGIGVAVAILTVDHNTLLHSQRESLDVWRADLEVRPTGGVEDPGDRLRQVPGVLDTTAVLQSDGSALTLEQALAGERRGRAVRVIGVEQSSSSAMGLYRLELGAELPPASERGALIGRAVAEQLGLGPGDELLVSRPPRAPRKVCVEGQEVEQLPPGEDPRPLRLQVAGVLAFEGLGRTSNGDVVVVDLPLAEQIFEGVFVQPSYWLARDPAVDLERLQQGLGPDFAYDLRQGAVVGQAADERAFRNGVRLSGLMALALGLFVIFHTLSMSLVERVREVAVLHALGASRAQIGRAFFAEALAIAFTAGALGLFGGLELARRMLDLGISSLGMTETVKGRFDAPWEQVVPLTLLGLSVALLGSVFPLLRAGRADTVAALRGEEGAPGHGVARGFHLFAALLLVAILPVIFFSVVDLVGEGSRELLGVVLLGVGVLALLVGTPLLVPAIMGRLSRGLAAPFRRAAPFAGLLAARSIERGPTRVAASVAAIALVTAAFVGLRGMTRSLLLETDVWAAEALADKVWIGALPEGTRWTELAEPLRAYPGVLAVEVSTHRIGAPFRVVGAEPTELARFGPLAEDPALAAAFAEGRGLIASRRLAKQRGLALGDPVPIATPGSGVQVFPVIAISDAYGYHPNPHERVYGVLARAHLERYFCLDTDRADLFSVVLAPGTDPRVVEAAAAEVLGAAAPLDVLTGVGLRRAEVRDIARDFFVFDVILLLTAALAGVGVLNGQLLAAMERAKELGVLRALGASSRQIAGSVLLESTVIGLAGGLLGTALGSLLVPVIVRSLRVLSGLDLPQPGLTAAAVLAPLAALALTLLAALYPIWRMNRMDPVRAVRTG
jgi:putative ABC transport system permease protein